MIQNVPTSLKFMRRGRPRDKRIIATQSPHVRVWANGQLALVVKQMGYVLQSLPLPLASLQTPTLPRLDRLLATIHHSESCWNQQVLKCLPGRNAKRLGLVEHVSVRSSLCIVV